MDIAQFEGSLFKPANPFVGRSNRGFTRMFQPGRLTLGLMFPVEAFARDEPTMHGQAELAQRAESAGFAALWVRDVPLRVPAFGDTGQVYDPWVWLGFLAARTRHIALVTGSIALPLRHPVHVAKAAASVDRLSGGRLVLGVASGDRAEEFPAFGIDLEARGDLFRERFLSIRALLETEFPRLRASWGVMEGSDLVPKPWGAGIPMLVTGRSRQALAWIAEHADGWITYPRALPHQQREIASWRGESARASPERFQPFAQSLYVDLVADPEAPATPIHLGCRAGRHALVHLLAELELAGAHHVAINLKYGSRPASQVLEELAEHVLPIFPRRQAHAA
jgi:luciferase-type oxidoreductase